MTASERARELGLESLVQAETMLGTRGDGVPIVKRQTLDNWFKHKPLLFDAVMTGLAARLKREKKK